MSRSGARFAKLSDPVGFGVPFTVWPTLVLGAAALAANRAYYLRVQGGGTISKIAVQIGTSSGNICAAVYQDAIVGGLHCPRTRIATTGSIASPGTGRRELSLGASVVVRHGDWFYLGADNATVTFQRLSLNGALALGSDFGLFEDAMFPAPSPSAVPAGPNNGVGSVFGMVGVA